jgi:hypothetical protein
MAGALPSNLISVIAKLSCSVHFHFKEGKSASIWTKRTIFQPWSKTD